jgi:hypothetical protein
MTISEAISFIIIVQVFVFPKMRFIADRLKRSCVELNLNEQVLYTKGNPHSMQLELSFVTLTKSWRLAINHLCAKTSINF